MRKTTKVVSAVLAAAMIFSLSACSSGSSTASTTAAATTAAATEAATTAAATEVATEAAATEAATEAAKEEAPAAEAQEGKPAPTSENWLKGKKVDVLLKSYTHMFWVEAANEAKQLGEEYGCDVEILAPTVANSNEEQIELIERSLITPPDIYIIVPADSAGIAPAIQEINDAGIPIVNVNTKISDESVLYDAFVSCNQYDLGYDTVSKGIELIGEEGKAVIINGKPGAQTYAMRTEGAYAAFADHAGWEVLDEQIANADRSEAMNTMQTLLTKYDNITMVYAEDGEMSLGCAEAIKQAGKTDDIKIIGENSSVEICQAIKDGNLFMMYDDAAWAQTKMGFEVANLIMGGQTVEKTYYSDIQLITSDNVDEYAKRYETN